MQQPFHLLVHIGNIMVFLSIDNGTVSSLKFIAGECKEFKDKFMACLKANKGDNFTCRLESKAYLECRMEKYVTYCAGQI